MCGDLAVSESHRPGRSPKDTFDASYSTTFILFQVDSLSAQSVLLRNSSCSKAKIEMIHSQQLCRPLISRTANHQARNEWRTTGSHKRILYVIGVECGVPRLVLDLDGAMVHDACKSGTWLSMGTWKGRQALCNCTVPNACSSCTVSGETHEKEDGG